MGYKTSIEWADATWNPVTGCTKVSEGCRNCYAERMVKRLGDTLHGSRDFGKVALHPDRLEIPLRWRKPRRVFVPSMGDLFHKDVPDEFIERVWNTFIKSPRHTFMVLTKRPERMADWLLGDHGRGEFPTLFNVWLGTSIEDQKTADERIPHLLRTPASVRFVSAEPLLGMVDLTDYLPDVFEGHHDPRGGPWLDLVIVGGESGPGARPMHPEWARSIRYQCADAGIAFQFKQWGEWAPLDENPGNCWSVTFDGGRHGEQSLYRVGKKAAGRALDGKIHHEWPEVRNGR